VLAWYGANLDNSNSDYDWSFTFDGSYLGGTVHTTFHNGSTLANAERYGRADTANASFQGLQYRPSLSPWTAWTSVSCFDHTDPDYNAHFNSVTYVVVNTSGTACPI